VRSSSALRASAASFVRSSSRVVARDFTEAGIVDDAADPIVPMVVVGCAAVLARFTGRSDSSCVLLVGAGRTRGDVADLVGLGELESARAAVCPEALGEVVAAAEAAAVAGSFWKYEVIWRGGILMNLA
jgi:hypothetical protein